MAPVPSGTRNHYITNGDRIDIADLRLLDGRLLHIQEPNRRGTLLVFWVTWCEICRAEIPALIEFRAREARNGIEVVGINVGEQARRISAYVKEYNIPYPIALDLKQQLMPKLGLEAIPSVVLVDSRGLVRYVGIRLPADPATLEHALYQAGIDK